MDDAEDNEMSLVRLAISYFYCVVEFTVLYSVYCIWVRIHSVCNAIERSPSKLIESKQTTKLCQLSTLAQIPGSPTARDH
jgi:hypothetical protein